jgi:hypothetical protein
MSREFHHGIKMNTMSREFHHGIRTNDKGTWLVVIRDILGSIFRGVLEVANACYRCSIYGTKKKSEIVRVEWSEKRFFKYNSSVHKITRARTHFHIVRKNHMKE